ncbi:MAG: TrkH family potassium uptake protein [Maricaulis sp.]|nr:TrkH family potassium uptake protein [Maricaulis sp.]MDG2044888.1 TrkH family potassium uptake protein [Maricaulis sp.]
MTASLRPVFFVIGIMVAVLSAAMLVPAAIDASSGALESARAFFISSVIGLFLGAAFALMNRAPLQSVTPRVAFILTVGSWLALALMAAVPLHLSGEGLSWTDSLFEAVSGLTTTGSTIVTELDQRPPGFLIWRAILQWIGGIGIIVTAMAFWPMLGVGGMQLFRMETTDASDKVLPRATEIAAAISLIYLALTLACAIGYLIVGMGMVDAFAHAMSTVATGGFSTSDDSLGHFTQGGADLVALVFMLLAALPFGLFLLAARGKPGAFLQDRQVRGFIMIIVLASVVLTLVLANTGAHGAGEAWRVATFNAVSIITGTGFATADYAAWGPAAEATFFVFMFVGGCAGSTTCSIKIFRFQIAGSAIRRYLGNLLSPNAIIPMHYNGRPVPDSAIHSVLGFFFVFFAVFAISAAILSAMGLDLTTAISGAATSLANVGPGLGDTIGPSGTFAPLEDPAKWVLTANMFIGRLEVLTVLVLLTPRFWRG